MKALTKKQAVKELKKRYSRKETVKKLDKAFADYIKARDGECMQAKTEDGKWAEVHGRCNGPLTCGHLITRSNYSTRWDEANAFGQCLSHNLIHEHHPEYMTEWYIGKYGLDKYQQLTFKSRQRSGIKTNDMLVLIEYYHQKTEDLRGRR